MKIVSIILLALAITQTLSTSCIRLNNCLSCSNLLVNYCLSCYNTSGTSSLGVATTPKILIQTTSTSVCSADIPSTLTITDCLRYNPTLTSNSTKDWKTCDRCNTSYRNYVDSTNTLTCSDTVATLSTVTCKEIDNCDEVMCWDGVLTDFTGCLWCSDGYVPSNIDTTYGIAQECVNTAGTITNCTSYVNNYTSVECFKCDENFSVSLDGTTCISYTFDSNCRKLDGNMPSSICQVCSNGYIWNGGSCYRNLAKIVAGCMIALLSGIMFW